MLKKIINKRHLELKIELESNVIKVSMIVSKIKIIAEFETYKRSTRVNKQGLQLVLVDKFIGTCKK